MEIRREVADDIAAIRALVLSAFPTPAEADLVDRLRADGDLILPLVAVADGAVVGYALLSRMRRPEGFLGLAPVAVAERERHRGVAGRLIREGLNRARARAWRGVFVLGGPYYERFGFDPALAAGFRSPYAGPHLMGLELAPGALAEREGPLDFAPAFDALG